MKHLIAFLITVIFLAAASSPVDARSLPRYKSGVPARTASGGGSTVTVSPKFLSGKSGLRVSFGGVNNAKKISYMLSYETNGKPEGVAGTVTPSEGNSTSRDMLFGTCSSGTCRYHSGLKNVKLEVRSELKNGKTAVRRYTMKI